MNYSTIIVAIMHIAAKIFRSNLSGFLAMETLQKFFFAIKFAGLLKNDSNCLYNRQGNRFNRQILYKI